MLPSDLAQAPDLAHEEPLAGPVRRRRPVYRDLLPPCNEACPAGEDIQGWLAHAQAGDYEAAWRRLVVDNPFPAIHGRVCYRPCEGACNRAQLDEAVSVHGVERFLGDLALENGWQLPAVEQVSGKRVLVVGAGPSGLSAAYHLARHGHEVEVRDAGAEPGGMMRYGIPAYRLPRQVLAAEIERLGGLGVKITTGHRISDLAAEREEGGFDAVFVAVGAELSHRVEVPAPDGAHIVDALSYLRQVADGEEPRLGRRVAIYGGGNTAMDAARTARRLGAEEALIVYRRTRSQMPAHAEEAEEAEREGVQINWLRTVKAFGESGLTLEAMELDESGRPQPTGRLEQLPADALVMAVGQDAGSDFLRNLAGLQFNDDGTVVVSAQMMTGCPGVFAGGDLVPGERSVTVSVGHGKRAARRIDAWLSGSPSAARPPRPKVAGLELLHLWYFGDFDRASEPSLPIESRLEGFFEVVGGLTEVEARYEAGRCLSCGNCFECDGCFGACPEGAVIKLGPGRRYRFDYEACTGCSECFGQCPVHAIEMVEDR